MKLNLLLMFIPILLSCSPDILIKEEAVVENLKETVFYLADSLDGRNYDQPENLDSAVDHITGKFKEAGFEPEIHAYKVNNTEYKNVYCRLQGKTNDIIIVGAHYDSCGRYPAADDNASGVAGLLETARIISGSTEKLDHTIIFVSFTLEEPPYFRTEHMGSYQFAKFGVENNWDVKEMIALDMIGYYSDDEQEYPSSLLKLLYPSDGNYIAAISNISSSPKADDFQQHAEALGQIECIQLAAPASLPGIDFSDHLNYWDLGYKAFMITNTAFYRNKEYHSAGDTSDRLDYTKMGYVVNALSNYLLTK